MECVRGVCCLGKGSKKLFFGSLFPQTPLQSGTLGLESFKLADIQGLPACSQFGQELKQTSICEGGAGKV